MVKLPVARALGFCYGHKNDLKAAKDLIKQKITQSTAFSLLALAGGIAFFLLAPHIKEYKLSDSTIYLIFAAGLIICGIIAFIKKRFHWPPSTNNKLADASESKKIWFSKLEIALVAIMVPVILIIQIFSKN